MGWRLTSKVDMQAAKRVCCLPVRKYVVVVRNRHEHEAVHTRTHPPHPDNDTGRASVHVQKRSERMRVRDEKSSTSWAHRCATGHHHMCTTSRVRSRGRHCEATRGMQHAHHMDSQRISFFEPGGNKIEGALIQISFHSQTTRFTHSFVQPHMFLCELRLDAHSRSRRIQTKTQTVRMSIDSTPGRNGAHSLDGSVRGTSPPNVLRHRQDAIE